MISPWFAGMHLIFIQQQAWGTRLGQPDTWFLSFRASQFSVVPSNQEYRLPNTACHPFFSVNLEVGISISVHYWLTTELCAQSTLLPDPHVSHLQCDLSMDHQEETLDRKSLHILQSLSLGEMWDAQKGESGTGLSETWVQLEQIHSVLASGFHLDAHYNT